jgi:hypothetical protein
LAPTTLVSTPGSACAVALCTRGPYPRQVGRWRWFPVLPSALRFQGRPRGSHRVGSRRRLHPSGATFRSLRGKHFPHKPEGMPQRTFGRGFVQPGNVKNTGAAPRTSKVSPAIQRPGLSRPRVLYIPFSVRPLRAHKPLKTPLHFPQSQAVCQACVFFGLGNHTRMVEPQNVQRSVTGEPN